MDEKEAFKEKLRSLNWGSVPGGARQKSGHDKQALRATLGDPDKNKNDILEATEGLGHLRWDKGDAYRKDRNTGDYTKLTASDYDRVMYGSSRRSPEASGS